MAQYKACCPVIAPIESEENGVITYGTGMILDRLMNVKVSPEYDNPKVFGDDGVAEEMNLFKSAAVELGTTTIPADAEPMMFGNTYDKEKQTIVDKEDDEGSYCGFGFFICERIKGKDVYKLHWIKKVKYKMPSDEFETKNETISFKTPSISGTAYADCTGEWRDRQLFDNASSAMSGLLTLANIKAE